MHFTCLSVPHSSRWLMIVSTTMAVLPVCRSPMMSSRWPRPIGVIASMDLMPVWRGSFTGCRETTDGACTSSGRVASEATGPLPSRGRPSGSTTRPSRPSPTGADRMRPVRLTGSPSSMSANCSSRITQPIRSSSRFDARPSLPPGNSSSSLAMVRGSPMTTAMPAPASRTRPTSSRSTEGLYFSIALRRASAISSGSKLKSGSAMASGAPQPLPCVFETGPDGPVEHLVAHPGKEAADHRGTDHHLDLHVLACCLGERPRQLLATLLCERDRRTHLRDDVLAPLGGQLGQALHDAAELLGSALLDQEPQDAHGVGVRPVAEQLLHQRPLVLRGERGGGERLTESRVALDGLGEGEQLVLHGPQVVLRLGHREQGLGVAPHDLVLGGHYPFPFPDPDTCLMNSSTSFCWVVLSSCFSTTRSASSTAIWPTWAESSRSTRSRSARISSVARATVARASCSALPWRSARSCSAVLRPSSMIRLASSRAFASCSRYRASSASASRRAASARSTSPWIFSLRWSRMELTLGSTHFHMKPNRMANAIAPTMSSEAWG